MHVEHMIKGLFWRYTDTDTISNWTELLWQSKKRTFTVPTIHERRLPLPAPESPSSPRLAIPTKKTLPSSATIRAWALSWPVATCTILGDLVMGSSAHFPGAGPPCLMPSDAALPEYRTWVGKQNHLRSTGNSGWVKKETSKKNELQRFCGTWEYSMCQCTHVHTIHMCAHTHTCLYTHTQTTHKADSYIMQHSKRYSFTQYWWQTFQPLEKDFTVWFCEQLLSD